MFFLNFDIYHKGYKERKALAEYISQDAKNNHFPCISISYITQPGENVGFRYFFWLIGLHVNQPKSGSPVYTIVIPDEYAKESVVKTFGHIGVIPPESVGTPQQIKISCSGQNSNITDPLLGYVEK